MNKFLKRIFFEDTGYRRAKSPLIAAFKDGLSVDYVPVRHQTRFQLKLEWCQDVWIDGNVSNDQQLLFEMKINVIKRLQHEIFSDIQGYIHELLIHLHNEDYDSSKKTVDLIKQAIQGE